MVALPVTGGGMIAAWSSDDFPDPTPLHAARLDVDGNYVWPGETVDFSTEANDTGRLTGAVSTDGYVAYAWTANAGSFRRRHPCAERQPGRHARSWHHRQDFRRRLRSALIVERLVLRIGRLSAAPARAGRRQALRLAFRRASRTAMSRPIYRFGDCTIDASARELRSRGALATLSPKVFDCLIYLIEHRERAVGRDELIAAVWGKLDVTDTLLGQTVLKARRAVGDSGNGQNVIRTIPRFGYRWVAGIAAEGGAEPNPRQAAQARRTACAACIR